MSVIEVRTTSLRNIKPKEYAARFLFGGLSTVVAGVVAHFYGPAVGGLFLAVPAIFPASASLIENHQKREKEQIGRDGANRGRVAASTDAAGASTATIGLVAFALVCWRGLNSNHCPVIVLAIAFLMWALISLIGWIFRKGRYFPRDRRAHRSPFRGR